MEERRPLTRRRIVEEALRLMDDEGEEKLSMRRLAARLGVDPMAVYRHVPDKAGLIHEVVEAVVSGCRIPPEEGPWQGRVRALCRSYRSVAREHPKVFPLVCVHQRWVPSDHAINEAFLAALCEAGLSPADAVRAATTLLNYAAGFALDEVTATMRPLTGAERRELAALPADRYPTTRRLLRELSAADLDADFEFGLDVLITGLSDRARFGHG